ncbi:hypothetical protein BI49514_01085 [Brevibacterium iodinum ATCC 49514]|uniref:Uncharacterized protein n=1 Tax=Brevibacterium iodinum ATCC 49514 TaxID=1255616 RepID=A0A2H1IL59_9MICO|nr:hypothetical protein BI49514_01085 [Brevibacterium iodinum ATCC 49514]SUW12254.1 Uncharacterised protein [Brevibacterium iodinum]
MNSTISQRPDTTTVAVNAWQNPKVPSADTLDSESRVSAEPRR